MLFQELKSSLQQLKISCVKLDLISLSVLRQMYSRSFWMSADLFKPESTSEVKSQNSFDYFQGVFICFLISCCLRLLKKNFITSVFLWILQSSGEYVC